MARILHGEARLDRRRELKFQLQKNSSLIFGSITERNGTIETSEMALNTRSQSVLGS